MSIRAKFFALAGILLVLFGMVVGILSLMQATTTRKLEDIVGHHQPLQRLLANLDVDTDEYELRIERLRRQPDQSPSELQAAAAVVEQVGARIRSNFEKLRAGLDEAVAYDRDDPDNLHTLSVVQGTLPLIQRQVDPFLDLGRRTVEAILAGKPTEAHELAVGFMRYEDAFGPDLAKMRQQITALTERTTARIYANQRLDTGLSFALFVLASAVGLVISGIGSAQVVGALRRLLASTKLIEEGHTDIAVPVLTRDEVGQLATAFNRMIAELRARERIKETFGKFVDPRIVSRLIGDGDNAPADRKLVTILFSDIQGFSIISEQLTAAAMVHLLNEYFTVVAEEIRQQNGIIDKFIGDSVMAFWCTPFSVGDAHALDACRACLAQRDAIARLRTRLPEITGLRRNAPDLVVRMGLASGEVVVGAVGSPNARSYTVIGDTVNLASRLEGVNKIYGTSVILADDTYRLAQHAIEVRELDYVTVAGKTEPIRIYELMGEVGALDDGAAQLRQTFSAGLEAYRQRNWDAAQQHFQSCLNLAPDDGPSAVYLKRVALLRATPPPPDWDGVWKLSGK